MDCAADEILEARAVGVTVDFYPIYDVNNNPRNPIINIRSFGEDPRRVAALGARRVAPRLHLRQVRQAADLAHPPVIRRG